MQRRQLIYRMDNGFRKKNQCAQYGNGGKIYEKPPAGKVSVLGGVRDEERGHETGMRH